MFTDTVGVLTSWDDGVLKITRRGGEQVRLAESALVAAKVVPDRAPTARRGKAPRHTAPGRRGMPAATVRELSAVAARGWPATETEQLGEWTLRAAEGFTARANSALAMGDPGPGGLDRALEYTVDWYTRRRLPALVQVSTDAPGGEDALAAELAGRGWHAERHALTLTAPLAPLADTEPDPRVVLRREPDAGWLARYGRAEEARGAALSVLTGAASGAPVWFASVPADPDAGPEAGSDTGPETGCTGAHPVPAAIGRCVVDGGPGAGGVGRWAGFAAIEVAPGQRRRGLARAVLAELARAALEEGASAAYLQVEVGNSVARNLYEGMGFATHHAYHYLRAPEDWSAGD